MAPRPSDLDLMCMHVETLYRHDARSRLLGVRHPHGRQAPRFFLGRTQRGCVVRVRDDVPDALAERLAHLVRAEPDLVRERGKERWLPERGDDYLAALASHAPIQHIWVGPAYWAPPEVAPPPSRAVEIREHDRELLCAELESWRDDVAHEQPFLATIEDGRAVSVCASVRIGPTAYEAGVQTLPAYRRKGHARSTVAAWIRAVRTLGATPLYSTSSDNTASQALAVSLGMARFGVDFHVG